MLLCRCFCKLEGVIGHHVVDSLPLSGGGCPQQCVDEATVEGLRTNRSQRIIRKTQSCFAHVNTVLHRRTRLLNCSLRCLRLTALVFCINKLGRSRCFHHEHGRNCEKLALSTPRPAGIASGSWGTDYILGSKM